MKTKSRPVVLVFSLLALLTACQSEGDDKTPGPTPISAGSWTWMSGGTTTYQPGVYGTRGTPDPANVPGSRHAASSWLDSQGNLWVFGGYGVDSAYGYYYLNDLWKHDPATLQWTWISGGDLYGQSGIYGTKGAADPANVPGARYAASFWLDPQGKLWLFGGYGEDWADYYGDLNDLWKFDPATARWTWMSGGDTVNQPGVYGTKGVADPANVPGGRELAAAWVDTSGRLWVLGGHVVIGPANYGDFNDLWMYDPSILQWTWLAGGDTSTQKGVYGMRGQADPSNVPGSRTGAVTWVDAGGRLWLFGGAGLDGFFDPGLLNDLWRFDPATGLWTWISGSSTVNHRGTYGTRGLTASANVPGARDLAATWIDSGRNLWLFGGFGYDLANDTGWLNDLWKFNPASLEWTWVGGSNVFGGSGVYGAKGTSAASNMPGARRWAVSRLGTGGRLWLFGGLSYDSTGTQGSVNDLWRYTR